MQQSAQIGVSAMGTFNPKRSIASNPLDISGLQMNNNMFVTKQVLDKQVEIMRNEKIPNDLKQSDAYVYRHLGNSEHSTRKMLDFMKYDTIDNFIKDVVPE